MKEGTGQEPVFQVSYRCNNCGNEWMEKYVKGTVIEKCAGITIDGRGFRCRICGVSSVSPGIPWNISITSRKPVEKPDLDDGTRIDISGKWTACRLREGIEVFEDSWVGEKHPCERFYIPLRGFESWAYDLLVNAINSYNQGDVK